jgi:hypothetical protein
MMWFNRPINLARTVLRGQPIDDVAPCLDAPSAAAAEFDPTPTDLHLHLSRHDLDRFVAALLASLTPEAGRFDDPARLAAALDLVVALIDGSGRCRVVLRPAGLATPEAWEIDVDGADLTTIRAFDRLSHGIPLPLASTGGPA